MNYKKILIGSVTISLLVGLASCSKSLDERLVNPNYPGTSTADVDLYLNQVQLTFNNLWLTASDYGAQLTRQQQWVGPFYRNAYTPASFDGEWEIAYAGGSTQFGAYYGALGASASTYGGVIPNADALIKLAQTQKKYIQSGIARILKAFSLGILVDDFGDVPYSEANHGNSNTNPKVDPGASIYAGIQTLLDSAILDLQNPDAAAGPANDLFYPGDNEAANWITLAKTLKLKFYMQTRLVDNAVATKIQALLTENDLINDPSQDFAFKYGTSVTAPDSRHEHYALDYVNSGGVGEYICNYFMWMVTAQKYGGTVNLSGDPRTRYYFYRQVGTYSWANSQTCPCFVNSQFGTSPTFPAWYPSVPSKTPYCVIGKGYMGRDHGDNSGAPPDGSYRTAFGVYPAAGEFDADQHESVSLGMGGQGAGINPIWLSSFTAFLEAEAALTLNITSQGTPRDLLEAGVNSSIEKVMSFPATVSVTPDPSFVPSATQVSNYVNLVLNNYDAATTDDARLNIIMTEYYLALWGNGVEPYNNYRRTGKPDNAQIAQAVPNPGFFMRSLYYPSVFVNRNANAPAQKTPGDAVNKVFWDNNPDNFVK
ncbi:SusD/RagB family nutrient-binding outer membrane lipoprotein [Flavitalea sp. BT771]|uniref:SusD/RagB family nutrient-binding outer membrane lipoprotein n=1 Tax=Flavitalea sp. BT771 TaxID=3063329 RepID=UPI0026E3EC38|nr:SusD/RagB family nutrient-binding outer membrane lipoprotein [Flavitalea sp. BT771]MDO6433760.1 SusD/RagB family nutrient-binding outer membrane lipoprotein [Flavitalea sp. BT771]MDV6222335.1 SusD/RagB family nutrient-binding outer membrane lipoprotein [Flavitalea sp. BT771]